MATCLLEFMTTCLFDSTCPFLSQNRVIQKTKVTGKQTKKLYWQIIIISMLPILMWPMISLGNMGLLDFSLWSNWRWGCGSSWDLEHGPSGRSKEQRRKEEERMEKEGRKEGRKERKEGRKEERKQGRKKGKKEGRRQDERLKERRKEDR